MRWNLERRDLPYAAHSDIPWLVDSGLDRQYARQIDLANLFVATFNFAADLQLLSIEHFDPVHQRRERIVEHRGEHSTHLCSGVLSLHAGEDQIEVLLLHE